MKSENLRRLRQPLLFALILTFQLSKFLQAQTTCSNTITPEQFQQLYDLREARQNFDRSAMRGAVRWVPVTWHLFRTSAGAGGLDAESLEAAMGGLNSLFSPANIQFYMCGNPKEIWSDALYNELLWTEANTYGAANDVPNTMNVYVALSVVGKYGGPPTNYSFFPGGPERVVMNTVGGFSYGVFYHEVGHFFGLMHTHGNDPGYPSGVYPELVNGSNCGYAGDLICDTPADPNDWPLGSCTYTGTGTDANGHTYVPDPSNFMSYASPGCYNHFTAQQYNVMAYTAMNQRAGLTCASSQMACTSTITSFPHNLGFESNSLGSWIQGNTDDFNWTLTPNPTPSANTGPDAAQAGNYFAFIEATGNTPNRNAELISPCLDMTKMVSPELTFRYHMYGAHIAGLRCDVSADAGLTWKSVFTAVGNQTNVWKQATVDLKQYVSCTFFRIRFTATTGAADLGDIGLDNIDIHSKACPGTTASLTVNPESCASGIQAGISSAVSGTSSPWTYQWSNGPTSSSITGIAKGAYSLSITDGLGCVSTLGAFVEESVTRIITNNYSYPRGESSADGAFAISVIGGTPPYSIAITNTTTSTTTTTTGVSSFPFSTTGLTAAVYGVVATDASGCQISTNVEMISPMWLFGCDPLGTISTLPYSEGFESSMGLWKGDCSINGGFVMLRNSGDTPQANTGPSAAAEGTWYVYGDALNRGTKTASELRGPWADFRGIARPNIRFKYHQYGASCNKVQVIATDSYTNPPLLSDRHKQLFTSATGDLGNSWQTATVDLSRIGNTNTHYLRLVAYSTSSGTEADIAFDDIQIFDCSGVAITKSKTLPSCSGNDGSATVGGPAGSTYLWSTGATTGTVTGLASGTYTVTVSTPSGCVLVETYDLNYTQLSVSAIVTHESLGGANDGAVDVSVYGGKPGYTYNWGGGVTTQDRSGLAPGNYTVTVTDAGGCTATYTASVSFSTCTDVISVYPYLESFESGSAGWNNLVGDDFDWTIPHTGSTPTANTGPSSASEGSYYAYTEVDGFTGSKTALLQGPCFDLNGLSAATFSFRYHMEASGGGPSTQMGYLYTEASTNNGATWTTIHTLYGNQGTAWNTANLSLASYLNQHVRIRFRAVSGTSTKGDRAIDKLQMAVTYLKQAEPVTHGQSLSEAVLFPNPTADQTTLRFEAASQEEVSVRVYDLLGHIVFEKQMSTQVGTNYAELETASMVPGTYLIDLNYKGGRIIQRLAVVR